MVALSCKDSGQDLLRTAKQLAAKIQAAMVLCPGKAPVLVGSTHPAPISGIRDPVNMLAALHANSSTAALLVG